MISISLWSSFHFRPPSGCLQYLFGNRVGTFETFNFASGSGHLVNQNYAVCIRQEFGLLSSRNANMTKSNNIFIFQAIAAYSTEFVMHQEPFLWIPMDLRRQAHRKLKQDVLEISSKLKVISRFQIQQLKSQPIFCYSVILASLRIFLFHLIGSMFQPQK